MGRRAQITVLAAAWGLSAVGLVGETICGYRYTHPAPEHRGERVAQTVTAIENEIVSEERAVLDGVEIDNLPRLRGLADSAPVVSQVVVLDAQGQVLPGGTVSRLPPSEAQRDRDRLVTELVPALELADAPPGERRSLFQEVDGRPRLVAACRRVAGDRRFSVVVEDDLAYVIAELFPQLLADPGGGEHFQVADDRGQLIYGYPLEDLQRPDVVEHPFSRTAARWRLRMGRERPTRRRLF